jgi:ABC-2 type transport system permease protein
VTAPAPDMFRPAPGRASAARMWAAQTAFELRLLVRNGEQLLLAVVIPVAALIGLSLTSIVDLPEPRVASALAGVLALAVLSAAFTSLAIATAFDRRYQVLKRLIGSGVPRGVLLAGKATSTAVVVAGQTVLLAVLALLLGWDPDVDLPLAVLALLLGVAALAGLGLLVGGLFKAEVVLGLANLLWLLFVVIGGIVVPLASGPDWLAAIGRLSPAGALSDVLRVALGATGGLAFQSVGVPLLVLAGWALAGWAATLQWFKWQ